MQRKSWQQLTLDSIGQEPYKSKPGNSDKADRVIIQTIARLTKSIVQYNVICVKRYIVLLNEVIYEN
jgi:hypothetical protein